MDRIPGGLADQKTPQDFDPLQIQEGIRVELEHTNDKSIAREIAMDHLSEDPDYYQKLKLIEGSMRQMIATKPPKWIIALGPRAEALWNETVERLGDKFNYGAATAFFKNLARKRGLQLPSHISSEEEIACYSTKELYAGIPISMIRSASGNTAAKERLEYDSKKIATKVNPEWLRGIVQDLRSGEKHLLPASNGFRSAYAKIHNLIGRGEINISKEDAKVLEELAKNLSDAWQEAGVVDAIIRRIEKANE